MSATAAPNPDTLDACRGCGCRKGMTCAMPGGGACAWMPGWGGVCTACILRLPAVALGELAFGPLDALTTDALRRVDARTIRGAAGQVRKPPGAKQ